MGVLALMCPVVWVIAIEKYEEPIISAPAGRVYMSLPMPSEAPPAIAGRVVLTVSTEVWA